ncbi:maleylpyruvate isomerase family mycothiol-dependent enzyme [Mycolicibacterium austroafricanum]|uniref:Maleylpyruvate isomerase family mycothiol-dependent enzyme n=1 Tax=Mycolicibacterium austroafricanum TaxID=39687 RepID=A0ABT8HLA9_MYCAO|nr:maleylpyruvate isomerase family mycothiol-dependent enzyme [Mycolicibacterium austroafricanum]MDN4521542.1 maleylpyruvate isomerase family mycothiol-dependent enzyme [Mycolicibacterium austroafricanum]
MDRDTVWRHIDNQRLELADLIDAIDARDQALWDTPSLCAGWTVRNVAAHLTHSTIGMPRMFFEAARSGFRFNAVVNRMAVSDDRSPAQIAANLRAVVGCRRHPPGTTERDPLTDVLLHTQDICVPLGIDRPMPVDAAVAAAERVWNADFPFHARKRLAGTRLVATDADFTVGEGREVAAPISALLMLLTGRK